jgi:hypothetical protein
MKLAIFLHSGAASAGEVRDEAHQEQNQENKEQDFSHPRRRNCDSRETKNCSDQRYQEKYNCPTEHSFSFSDFIY